MKNKVITNSIVYTICGLLLKCFNFFLLPLYTSYLTTSDYGITTICTSFTSVMGFIIPLSLYSAIMRFYVEYKDDGEKLKTFYGTIVSFVFISGAIVSFLLICFNKILIKYIFQGIDFFPIIFVCIINLVFSCQHTVYGRILQSQQKAMRASVVSVISFLFTVALNILFVVGFRMGALGALLSTLICNVVITIYFIIELVITKQLKFAIDKKILKETLKYSIPIIPHNLSTHLSEFLSKILIGGSGTLSALGIYSVAAQFGVVADTIQSYVNSAYGPWLYEKLHSDKSDVSGIAGVVEILCFAIGVFMLGICFFAQDYIFLFISREYHNAYMYIPLIVLVYLIKIPYYFYINILFYYKDASRRIFIATITGSMVNILLSAFLIQYLIS